FADSIAILKEAGLPKQEFQTMGQVFKKDGLVSSPMQERAQMIFALSQELSRTVSEIDGVLSARVHLVLPENDPLRQQLVPSSASSRWSSCSQVRSASSSFASADAFMHWVRRARFRRA